MVELNMDDTRELKRITALEMQGTLDADWVKAFVEVSWLKPLIYHVIRYCQQQHPLVCIERNYQKSPNAFPPYLHQCLLAALENLT